MTLVSATFVGVECYLLPCVMTLDHTKSYSLASLSSNCKCYHDGLVGVANWTVGGSNIMACGERSKRSLGFFDVVGGTLSSPDIATVMLMKKVIPFCAIVCGLVCGGSLPTSAIQLAGTDRMERRFC